MDGSADALGVVPAHTYARLRFDEAAEQAVQHLGYVLQMHQGSPYQGQFVAQSEQRAGAYRARFRDHGWRGNPRDLLPCPRPRGVRDWGCDDSDGRPTLGGALSLCSREPFAHVVSRHTHELPSGARTHHACDSLAISPGSRARADRPAPRSFSPIALFLFAGMGCSPPHIALLSGLQGTGMTGRQITDVLNRLAMQFGPVQGRLLPRCKCVPPRTPTGWRSRSSDALSFSESP